MQRLFGFMLAAIIGATVPLGAAWAITADEYQAANVRTGAELATLCAQKPDGALGTAALNLCHGYARGAVAAYTQIEAASRRKTKIFCLPSGTASSANEILTEFASWVKADVMRGQERAVDALFGYLAGRFPCGK